MIYPTTEYQTGTWALAKMLLKARTIPEPEKEKKPERYDEREITCACGVKFIACHNSARFCPTCNEVRKMELRAKHIALKKIKRQLARQAAHG